jgi:hypothetical protein
MEDNSKLEQKIRDLEFECSKIEKENNQLISMNLSLN